MTTILTDLSQPSLIHAVEANSWDFAHLLKAYPGAELYRGSDLIWVLTDIPSPVFNMVAYSNLADDEAGKAIHQMQTRALRRGVPLMWQVGPAAKPADLGERLLAQGFALEETVPGMAAVLADIDTRNEIPVGLEVAGVSSADELEAMIQAFTLGYEIPVFIAQVFADFLRYYGFSGEVPIQHYVATLDGEPLACSTLLLGGGVAGLYNIATVPSARRRGIGAAVTLAPLLEARQAGYRAAILHASAQGEPLYRRLGFEAVCQLEHYVWTPGGNIL